MYTATIGLEIHVELKTRSKMFCGCKNDPHDAEPNTLICPICMAHPGTLPVPNKQAIESVVTFGQAVGGTIATYSEFDRKNYFYPDIPKAYQLSQYAFPFVRGGMVAGVLLTRVHLEEDTARSQHDKGDGSLVDYNRAGVPLMELVTEPVIHDAKTAGDFARELQLLLRTLKISDANMERGEMRVEANISVSKDETLGTKVEVKNLNSFRSVEAAINYEIDRHIQVLEAGGVISQETRGWDEQKLETFSQRSKETAKDYRYFPDPDIPKLDMRSIEAFRAEKIAEKIGLLPQEKREKYSYLGLPNNQIEDIITNQHIDAYFAEVLQIAGTEADLVKVAANYILTDFSKVDYLSPTLLAPSEFVSLMRLVVSKQITSRVAKDLLAEFANNSTDMAKVIADRGLSSNFSEADLMRIVDSVIADAQTVVAEYRAGKTASIQYLLGQAMKQTKGAADPTTLKALFESRLQ